MVTPKIKPYSKVSFFYERMMKFVNYKQWADYILDITANYVSKESSVLELGAGTCKLTKHLVKHFGFYAATDLSHSMIKEGNKRLFRTCCDMRSIPFKRKFDLILCTFDTVNYLLEEKEIEIFFGEVSKYLKKKSIFTFDVSMEKNSLIHAEERIVKGSYKNYKYEKVSEYDEKTKLHTNTFYISSNDGLMYKEDHHQRIYPFETYFDLLEKAGMLAIECYEAFTFEDGNQESERLQFLVRKK